MSKEKVAKRERLASIGALHPFPEKVTAECIGLSGFFDPEDLLQMKYEMLRRVNAEGDSVREAARAFGLSRVAFYHAQAKFLDHGLSGLLPRKRGPKQSHKLTPEVMDHVRSELKESGDPDWESLSRSIEERFGRRVHPHSIRRAVRKERGGV